MDKFQRNAAKAQQKIDAANEENGVDWAIMKMMVDEYKERHQLVKKDDQYWVSHTEAEDDNLDMRVEIDQLRAEVSGLQELLKSAHKIGYDAGYYDGYLNAPIKTGDADR